MVKLFVPKNYFHNINIQNESTPFKKNFGIAQLKQKEKVNINNLLNRVKLEEKSEFKKKLLYLLSGLILISSFAILVF